MSSEESSSLPEPWFTIRAIGFLVLVANAFTVFMKGGGPDSLWIGVLVVDGIGILAFIALLLFRPAGVSRKTLISAFKGFILVVVIYLGVWVVLGGVYLIGLIL